MGNIERLVAGRSLRVGEITMMIWMINACGNVVVCLQSLMKILPMDRQGTEKYSYG